MVNSGCGLGFLPKAPGTFGTLWGIPLFYVLSRLSFSLALLLMILFILFAVWTSDRVQKLVGQDDPSFVVIDEIVGYGVSVLGWSFDAKGVCVAFILFRLFDIWKPWPVRWLDRNLSGGWGIVLDDVAAGVYANLVGLILFQGLAAYQAHG